MRLTLPVAFRIFLHMDSPPEAAPPSAGQARWCVVLAALLWSTSGAFTKVLTIDTPLHLDRPEAVDASVIACLRVLFAGVVLVPFVRRRDIRFRPMMLAMVAGFAVMNYLFVRAMAEGTSANAIFLQYTAPMWMFLASIWLLGEPADRRSFAALAIGLVGIAIIVVGGGQEAKMGVVALGLGSGVAYATVVICLRVLRNASSRWLTLLNFLVSAAVLRRSLPSCRRRACNS
jgi:drug/metabolite transporter, DME family